MLAELPFTTAEDIAAEYKPGVSIGVKSALRTLRGKHVISDGVGIRPRGDAGRVSGGRHLYSSLNLDAVRLHRRGDERGAKQLARRAAQLERRKETQQLAGELAQAFGQHEALSEAIEVLLSSDARGVVRAVAERTEAERRTLDAKLGLGLPTFARIAKIQGDIAVLHLERSGSSMPIRVSDLGARNVLVLGAGVSLRWETLGHGLTLLKADAAFDLSEDDSRRRVHPYDRPLPTEDARVALSGALATEATVRRPRVLAIGGSK